MGARHNGTEAQGFVEANGEGDGPGGAGGCGEPREGGGWRRTSRRSGIEKLNSVRLAHLRSFVLLSHLHSYHLTLFPMADTAPSGDYMLWL